MNINEVILTKIYTKSSQSSILNSQIIQYMCEGQVLPRQIQMNVTYQSAFSNLNLVFQNINIKQ